MSRTLCLLLLLIFSTIAKSQPTIAGHISIQGTVIDSETQSGIAGINIQNLTTKQVIVTAGDGSFSFEGDWGTRIQVSGTGYKSRFITFTSQPLALLVITLSRQSTALSTVTVSGRRMGYTAESTARAETYARPLARQHGGSIMSPATWIAEKLSKRSKAIFRFQKEFAEMEDQRLVDSRYTPQLTASMTKLSGDTLAYFMNAYPMPVDMAAGWADIELKMWIRNNYHDWIAKGRPVPAITATADSTLRR